MNWIRRNVQPRLRAIALASTVLPVPGTSSISRWPRHMSATRARRTSWCLPTMTRSTLARTLSPTCWMLLIGLPSATAPAVVLPCRGPDGRPGLAVTSRNGIGAQATSLPPRRVYVRALNRVLNGMGAGIGETVPTPNDPLLHVGVPTGENVQTRGARQPRNSVSPPTHSTIRQPIAPITPRNGSPPANAATRDDREQRAAGRARSRASPMRSMSGRRPDASGAGGPGPGRSARACRGCRPCGQPTPSPRLTASRTARSSAP